MATTAQRVCSVCGRDVSQDTRTKDARGRYYCASCAAQLRNDRVAKATSSAARAAAMCSLCGASVDAQQAHNDEGTILCQSCWGSVGSMPVTGSDIPYSADDEPPRPSPEVVEQAAAQWNHTRSTYREQTRTWRQRPGLMIGVRLVIAVVIGGLSVWLVIAKPWNSRPPLSTITFAEFDANFAAYSNVTDAQREARLAQYKGKRVRWEGIVHNVEGDRVYILHKATTMTSDVTLTVNSSERNKLGGLSKGELVVYEGTIADFGTILNHQLKDGVIVNHHRLTLEERLKWLGDSEGDVLRRLSHE